MQTSDGPEHLRRNTQRASHEPIRLRASIGARRRCEWIVCGLSASQAQGWIAADRLPRAAGAHTDIDAVARREILCSPSFVSQPARRLRRRMSDTCRTRMWRRHGGRGEGGRTCRLREAPGPTFARVEVERAARSCSRRARVARAAACREMRVRSSGCLVGAHLQQQCLRTRRQHIEWRGHGQ